MHLTRHPKPLLPTQLLGGKDLFDLTGPCSVVGIHAVSSSSMQLTLRLTGGSGPATGATGTGCSSPATGAAGRDKAGCSGPNAGATAAAAAPSAKPAAAAARGISLGAGAGIGLGTMISGSLGSMVEASGAGAAARAQGPGDAAADTAGVDAWGEGRAGGAAAVVVGVGGQASAEDLEWLMSLGELGVLSIGVRQRLLWTPSKPACVPVCDCDVFGLWS